jgi:hypothetical protein
MTYCDPSADPYDDQITACPRCDGAGAHLTGCDDILARACQLGTEAGKSAASFVFDGNTTREHYARVLAGIDDGDPEVMDAYREPSLSGEFGDDYTIRELADDLGIDAGGIKAGALDEASAEWNQAASAGFWDEVERTARVQLSD